MERYFWMQGKRLGKCLPGAILASLVLLGSRLAIFGFVVRQDAESAEKQKFPVALVGYTDEPFLQMGLTALAAFDSSRFSLDIRQMELESAQKALAQGDIAAYVEIPEGFINEALMGNILPLKFVSTTGATGLVSIFKDEITDVISQILLSAQKGVYGMESAVWDNYLPLGNKMNTMSIRYADFVFVRDRAYSLEELGIADALGLEGYLLCGLSVLFLLLCCLPFAPLLIRRDLALRLMLCARGHRPMGQALVEFCAYFLCLFVMILLLLVGAEIFAGDAFPFGAVLIRLVPVILMAAALSYMLCCLSTDLTGGLVLQFFTVLALCFVSGCLYPVYVFPVEVQQAAAWLPAGIARRLLSGCITGQAAGWLPVWLLGYSLVFFLVGSLVSARRVKGVAG